MKTPVIIDQSKFKYTDFVLSFRDQLIKEFLDDNDIESWKCFNEVAEDLSMNAEVYHGLNWRIAPCKNMNFRLYPDNIARYPVAWKLVSFFGDDCPGAGYSALKPHSNILPHADEDNRESGSKYYRIQIPLIIPEGDIAIKVEDYVHRWSSTDLFIFDNSIVHSVWNKTDELRVIYLFDLPKTEKYFDL